MSVRAQTWVWDCSDTNGNDRLVLLYLADQSDDEGMNSFPSIRRIADRCRVHTDTVKRTIERLEALGEVVVQRPERQGRGYFNRYTLVMGRPLEAVEDLIEKGRDLRPLRQPGKARERAERGAPGARLPIDPQTPGGITSVVDANARGERDASIERFDAHFWPAYPDRNGKKLDKGKALAQWVKLSIDDQRAAVRGARNYAGSGQLPKDAHRWLRDRCWVDWQTPAAAAAQRGTSGDYVAEAMQAMREGR